MKATEKLIKLGEYLGCDAIKYINARRFFEAIERLSVEGTYEEKYRAAHVLDALNTVYNAVTKAPGNAENKP